MSEQVQVDVYSGVDTHRDMHVAAVVDTAGRILGTAAFPADRTGYEQMNNWLRSQGRIIRVGVEGTGSYGAGLARHLTGAGVEVVEVNRPNRQLRRRLGKTDTVDAIAAARAALNGEATAQPKSGDGPVEGIRMLRVARRSAVKARTQAVNQIHGLVVTAPDQVKHQLRGLSTQGSHQDLFRFSSGYSFQYHRVRQENTTHPGSQISGAHRRDRRTGHPHPPSLRPNQPGTALRPRGRS